MTSWWTSVAISAMLASLSIGTSQRGGLPKALEEMIATERAFAKLGAEVGPRDSFLVYFADDAVTLDSEPRPAKDDIRKWPAPTPGTKLLWEPRTGDIAGSGDLGYLTGPVVRLGANGAQRHSCYMSVWKRQADGTFKVVVDFGIDTPGPVSFAPGFTRAWTGPRHAGRPKADDARKSLEAVERTLADRVATQPLAAAFASFLTNDTRVYRNKLMPLVGTTAIAGWLEKEPRMRNMAAEHIEVGASGDLGYTWGSYVQDSSGADAERGHFVRVWGRDASGGWHILFDVARAVQRD